jgi:hypothetical protein
MPNFLVGHFRLEEKVIYEIDERFHIFLTLLQQVLINTLTVEMRLLLKPMPNLH